MKKVPKRWKRTKYSTLAFIHMASSLSTSDADQVSPPHATSSRMLLLALISLAYLQCAPSCSVLPFPQLQHTTQSYFSDSLLPKAGVSYYPSLCLQQLEQCLILNSYSKYCLTEWMKEETDMWMRKGTRMASTDPKKSRIEKFNSKARRRGEDT